MKKVKNSNEKDNIVLINLVNWIILKLLDGEKIKNVTNTTIKLVWSMESPMLYALLWMDGSDQYI